MPLLWRLSEVATAFDQVSPSAIVTVASFAGHQHAETMRDAALEALSIRYIFSFGSDLPDGVTDISDWLDLSADSASRSDAKSAPVGLHQTAMISWGVAPGSGPLAVPRTHAKIGSSI